MNLLYLFVRYVDEVHALQTPNFSAFNYAHFEIESANYDYETMEMETNNIFRGLSRGRQPLCTDDPFKF